MARKHGQSLAFGPEYPRRPPFFAMSAMRLMSHYAVAGEVGLLGFAILVEVVLTEDRRRYSSPPRFWASSFYDRFARGKDAVGEAISRCQVKGWLHWDQPSHRVQATAWLTLPQWIDQSVLGDWAEKSTIDPPKHPANDPPNHPSKHPANDPASSIPSLPFPSPTPTGDEWREVWRAMLEIGIQETEKPLCDLRAHGVPPALALATLQFAAQAKRWKPGKIRRRLSNLAPGDDPTELRRWPEADFAPPSNVLTSAASSPATSGVGKLRQLELQFDLKSKSVEEVLTSFALPEALQLRLQPYREQRWDRVNNDDLRLSVAEFLESRANSMN